MRRLLLSSLLFVACGQNPAPPTAVPIASSVTTPTPTSDCDAGSDYVAQPDWSGRPPTLPPIPTLPTTPIKSGEAYTVFGAVNRLRSATHHDEVTSGPITIVGYIVDSNIPRAPSCAIHRAGKADPPDCTSEPPMFWIADEKGATTDLEIRVVGWARNFAIVFDAMAAYKKLKPGAIPKTPIVDDVLNVALPFPLPAVGMKVKVTGRYDYAQRFAASTIRVPTSGVMAMMTMDTLEPAPAPASFAKR